MPKRIRIPMGQNVWFLAGFLDGLLRGGPMPSKEIQLIAEASGYSWSTMQRAKRIIGVVSYKEGDAWYWALDET